MTKDEALDMALEALENWLEFDPENFGEVDKKAITAIKQARSAPVQEPMALEALAMICVKCRSNEWGLDTPRKEILNWFHDFASKALDDAAPPAAQRQWVGLTDEEIEKVWQRTQANDFHDCVQPFARAIEAKIKDKNNG
jgi:hypothetical protein